MSGFLVQAARRGLIVVTRLLSINELKCFQMLLCGFYVLTVKFLFKSSVRFSPFCLFCCSLFVFVVLEAVFIHVVSPCRLHGLQVCLAY